MLKYYRDGRAIYESSGTEIKDEARTTLRQREGDIAHGKQTAPKAARLLTFDQAVANVVNDYTANQRRSIADVKRRIDLHLIPYFGGRRMSTIDEDAIRAYIAARLDDKAKPATVNRELAIVKRAFRLAKKLPSKPEITLLEEKNIRQGFFERDQFEAVRRHLPEPLRPVMTFAFLTGWRVRSEVLPLTWAQVDTDAQIIRLEVGTTKNDEGRTFPYGVLPELAAVLRAQDARRKALQQKGTICPWVFPTEAGKRQSDFYSAEWRAACKAAGCPGKIPHDFRRTAVRSLVRAGVAEHTAMKLTGHRTRSIFDRYDIVNEADLRVAVERLADLPAAPRKRAKQR
jgi:integrase